MRDNQTELYQRDVYELASAFYFLGVYDGALRFDWEKEVDALESEEEIYEQLGRAIAGDWEFPEGDD